MNFMASLFLLISGDQHICFCYVYHEQLYSRRPVSLTLDVVRIRAKHMLYEAPDFFHFVTKEFTFIS